VEVAKKRSLVPDDHMVEAFAPQAADQAFDERILPGRPGAVTTSSTPKAATAPRKTGA